MPLPKRSQSQTVRVPRFLRASTMARPVRFGHPGPEVLPAATVVEDEVADDVGAPPPPVVTMPAAPTEDASAGAVPPDLLEAPQDAGAGGDAEQAAEDRVVDDEAESTDADREIAEETSSEDEEVVPTDVNQEPAGAPEDAFPRLSPEVVAEMTAAIGEIAEASRRDALALGLALARRLIGLSINADEEALRKLVQEAFAQLSAATALEVSLHPEDIAFFEASEALQSPGSGDERGEQQELVTHPQSDPSAPSGEPLEAARPDATVRLVADPALARGEAKVSSDVGDVNATLDARLAVARAVLEELE